MKTEKYQYIDELRLLACFGVIVLHVSGVNMPVLAFGGMPWQVTNLFNGLVRFSVPVFFMISGALHIARPVSIGKMYGKYILKVFSAYVFWSIFYALAKCVFIHRGLSVLPEVLLEGQYHLWYLPYLLGLYAVTPILQKAAEDRALLKYIMLVCFIRSVAVPLLLELPVIGEILSGLTKTIPLSFFSDSLLYYILGYWLAAEELTENKRKGICAAGAAGLLMSVFFTAWQSVGTGKLAESFYSSGHILIVLASAAVFVLFKYNSPLSRFRHKGINYAPMLFGVYLIHDLFLKVFQLAGQEYLQRWPLFMIPIVSVLIFFFSCLASAALNRIPFLNRFIV